MIKGKSELHILTEFCPFAMGFVIITPEDRAIIIDGGTYTEVPNVKAHVGDRQIAAWILTHTDGDMSVASRILLFQRILCLIELSASTIISTPLSFSAPLAASRTLR